MDPITALSLACNVMQLVQQAINVTRTCKTLYERGSLDENDLIENHAKDITAANKELEAALKGWPSTPRDKRLQDVASDVSKTADKLRIELNKLKLSKTQGNPKVGRAFKTALIALCKKGKINDIQATLEKQEKALQSGLLKGLL